MVNYRFQRARILERASTAALHLIRTYICLVTYSAPSPCSAAIVYTIGARTRFVIFLFPSINGDYYSSFFLTEMLLLFIIDKDVRFNR